MTNELQMTAIQLIQQELEGLNNEITGTQSIQHLIDLGGKLSSWIAFSGDQMAKAKKIWRRETARAYDNHVFSRMAQGHEIQATMANKYAAARAGDNEADWDLCERVNRTCVHALDFLRTVISALKEEQKTVHNTLIQ